MSKGWESQTADYIIDHRLKVDLAEAHRKSVADLQHDFSAENETEGLVRGISQGFAHEIHAVISEVMPGVDMLNARLVRIEEMLDFPDIKKIDGSLFQKVVILGAIVDSIAEAVADVIWHHKKGVSYEESIAAAAAIGDDEADAVDAEWEGMYKQAKTDFGL